MQIATCDVDMVCLVRQMRPDWLTQPSIEVTHFPAGEIADWSTPHVTVGMQRNRFYKRPSTLMHLTMHNIARPGSCRCQASMGVSKTAPAAATLNKGLNQQPQSQLYMHVILHAMLLGVRSTRMQSHLCEQTSVLWHLSQSTEAAQGCS